MKHGIGYFTDAKTKEVKKQRWENDKKVEDLE